MEIEYQAPASPKETVALLAEKGERTCLIAGGSDLLVWLHKGLLEADVYGAPPAGRGTPVLACNVEDMVAADVGAILDGDYGIAVRTGLHCAPLVHADLGAPASRTVRLSLGYSNTSEDIDQAIQAMAAISGGRAR